MGPTVIKSPWVIELHLAAVFTIVNEITAIFSVANPFCSRRKDVSSHGMSRPKIHKSI